MMVTSFRVPESVDEFNQMFGLFLEDAFPGQVLLNAGDTDESIQIDFQSPAGKHRYFFTFEDDEAYSKRLRPEAWAARERKKTERANGQPAASLETEPEPDASEEEAEGDRDVRELSTGSPISTLFGGCGISRAATS